jgi:hypothetical protein
VPDRRSEPDQIAVRVGMRALAFSVVVIDRTCYLGTRCPPFGGERRSVIDVDVEHRCVMDRVVVVGEVDCEVVAVREGVGVVVIVGVEAEPLIVGHGAVNIEHSETRLVTGDLHSATLALSRVYMSAQPPDSAH